MRRVIGFEGAYADLLHDYVTFRQGLGFTMPESSQRILRRMSEYLYTLPLIPEVINRKRAEEISAKRQQESDRTRQCRYVVLRQFCLYLGRMGFKAYVPPAGLVRARIDFVPRIVSESEMAHIIAVAKNGTLHWPVMILKILWCTGIRISEATALRVGDFHEKRCALYIAHAKNDRSRIIPIHPSLASDLSDYVQLHVIGTQPCDWLFPGRNPEVHRNKVAVGNRLREVYRKAGVLTKAENPIRTHDLRHSFAIRSLENMVESGQDIYVTLPYLSAYMGHANIYDTEYYLRFLPSAHQGLIDCEQEVSHVVFGGDGA
jgi:integrase